MPSWCNNCNKVVEKAEQHTAKGRNSSDFLFVRLILQNCMHFVAYRCKFAISFFSVHIAGIVKLIWTSNQSFEQINEISKTICLLFWKPTDSPDFRFWWRRRHRLASGYKSCRGRGERHSSTFWTNGKRSTLSKSITELCVFPELRKNKDIMNPLGVLCLVAFVVAGALATPTQKNQQQNLKPSQWLQASELESIPSLDELSFEQLEGMPLEKGAKLMRKLCTYEIRMKFEPKCLNLNLSVFRSLVTNRSSHYTQICPQPQQCSGLHL